jgi:Fic family protein
LLNSQFSYNQLAKIQDIDLQVSTALQNACNACWKSLYHLNGFIDACTPAALRDDLLLLQIADAKYSFELDSEPVSFTRLFEALSSENYKNDQIPEMIFNYISYFQAAGKIDLHALKPAYYYGYRKNQELFRDKKEITVKSYHTNLTLYTAPSQYAVIRTLKDELDFLFRHPLYPDELLHMCLCHFQVRALAPYNELNHHVARVYSQLWLKSLHLNFDFLPIARVISANKEPYQLMMREVVNGGNYAGWCLYFMDIVQEAALKLLASLKQIQALKKNTLELMAKYTDYPLPAADLMPVIFSRPYIKPKYLVETLDCHRQTAYAYLEHLVKAGILVGKKSGREKLYLHKQLFDVLSN